MKQLIIVRKDLNMSVGKTASQCCHASISFLTKKFRDTDSYKIDFELEEGLVEKDCFDSFIDKNELFILAIEKNIFENWINDSFVKIICGAKNKNQLLKAKAMAEELGLKENEDFFLIKDNCSTELEPEEYIDGVGKCLTCIGFKPLENEIVEKISKKYQLLK